MPQDMYLSFITKKITEYLKTVLPEKKKKKAFLMLMISLTATNQKLKT